ncbi:hypothetical protein DO580_24645, partial [Salmonella enterica subsp. enterica]|nr:hypothetical protein [Salmonella enterica subsp. enterica serovar Senftenberg]
LGGTMKAAFDLTLVEKIIDNDPESIRFRNELKIFISIYSVYLDLVEVRNTIDAYGNIQSGAFDSQISRALLTHAVIIYCRASHTKSRDRNSGGVTGAYSEDQMKEHNFITNLRDKVFAHFGLGGGWNDERVILIKENDEFGIKAVHHRVNVDTEIFDKLRSLTDSSIPHVHKKIIDRVQPVFSALWKIPSSVVKL